MTLLPVKKIEISIIISNMLFTSILLEDQNHNINSVARRIYVSMVIHISSWSVVISGVMLEIVWPVAYSIETDSVSNTY